MTRRWSPPTWHTLRGNTVSIMNHLIWNKTWKLFWKHEFCFRSKKVQILKQNFVFEAKRYGFWKKIFFLKQKGYTWNKKFSEESTISLSSTKLIRTSWGIYYSRRKPIFRKRFSKQIRITFALKLEEANRWYSTLLKHFYFLVFKQNKNHGS